MSQWQYLKTTFTLALRHTLEIRGHTGRTLSFAAVSIFLGALNEWRANGLPAIEEVLSFAIGSLDVPAVLLTAVFTWHFLWNVPYTLHAQLSERLAKISDHAILQPSGYGDNTLSSFPSRDLNCRLVLIRNLVIVNRSERDEVVSLKLWWPFSNNSEVLFSPQADPPPEIGQIPLLSGAENIFARESLTRNVLFRIPKGFVSPGNRSPFLIIIVTSLLTGTDRAFNTMTFTEVRKPYPRTLDDLNQQLATST